MLDDYQDVARSIVEWPDALEVVSFTDHLVDPDALVGRLGGFDVVVAMRERTAFPAAVLERLPDLRLLVTTGLAQRGDRRQRRAATSAWWSPAPGASSATPSS